MSEKYELLENFLLDLPKSESKVTLTFQDIEKIIRQPLPDSARNHRAWWSNQKNTHSRPHAATWINSGFKVYSVNQTSGVVTFVRNSQGTQNEQKPSNPDWTRDELIVALNAYLRFRSKIPNKNSIEIAELSLTIKELGQFILGLKEVSETFRNTNGVYMKLMNFRRLDPRFTAQGKKGLSAGNKGEEEVWLEFANDPKRCQNIADAILSGLKNSEIKESIETSELESAIEEAAEGRLLSYMHVKRERNSKLRESKKREALKQTGKLACEICDFDFSIVYGERGHGFIECHHKNPLSTLKSEQTTRLDDLALVCANCHRMIHRTNKWLTIEELKEVLKKSSC